MEEFDHATEVDLNSLVNVLLPLELYKQPPFPSETSFDHLVNLLQTRLDSFEINQDILFSICNILQRDSAGRIQQEQILPSVLSRLRPWRLLPTEEKADGLEKLAVDLSEIANGRTIRSTSEPPSRRLRIRWICSGSEDLLGYSFGNNVVSETSIAQEGAVVEVQSQPPENEVRVPSPGRGQTVPGNETVAFRSGCCACRRPRNASKDFISRSVVSPGSIGSLATASCPTHRRRNTITKPVVHEFQFPLAIRRTPKKPQPNSPVDENIPPLPLSITPLLSNQIIKSSGPCEPPVHTLEPLPWPIAPRDTVLRPSSPSTTLRRSTRLNTKPPQLSSSSSISASNSRSQGATAMRATPHQRASSTSISASRSTRPNAKYPAVPALSSSFSFNANSTKAPRKSLVITETPSWSSNPVTPVSFHPGSKVSNSKAKAKSSRGPIPYHNSTRGITRPVVTRSVDINVDKQPQRVLRPRKPVFS